jgi:phosphate-selective porin
MKKRRIRYFQAMSMTCLLLAGTASIRAGQGANSVRHGSKGFEFATEDGRFLLQFQSRLQLRYYNPFDKNPVTYDDFDVDDQSTFKVNRARIKIGGHGFEPWLKYYWESDLVGSNLLDFKIMAARYEALSVKVGQWKVDYNRERVISSGKQQMADRSIVNMPFTIDRQQGVALYGRLKNGGPADFAYWLGVFTGTGRGSLTNDDENMMYTGRLQWNFTGREPAFSGSDTKYHEDIAGLVAFAAATNRSPYTRFSTAGGGQLPGFEDGGPGQYRVNQWVAETALMFRGFSWQQELHWKKVKDHKNSTETTLSGNYVQLGYFFHYLWERVPRPLELAFLYAFYRPDTSASDGTQREYSLAANWFFKGHLNKLTAEVSYFVFPEKPDDVQDGYRFRLQWDISI